MELLTWCCYFFAAVFLINVCINAVLQAVDLSKIKLNRR
jgi:hypothetical protein